LTLAGHLGVTTFEQYDIALEDELHGFLDPAGIVGQGGFGFGSHLVNSQAQCLTCGGGENVFHRRGIAVTIVLTFLLSVERLML
jgi:hypothetical protein